MSGRLKGLDTVTAGVASAAQTEPVPEPEEPDEAEATEAEAEAAAAAIAADNDDLLKGTTGHQRHHICLYCYTRQIRSDEERRDSLQISKETQN